LGVALGLGLGGPVEPFGEVLSAIHTWAGCSLVVVYPTSVATDVVAMAFRFGAMSV
jgi:hypothetical protein